MRIIVAVLLAVHGAIHLLGFLQAWKLAALPQLGGRTLIPLSDLGARVVGVGWAGAAALLLVAAALRLGQQRAWWMPAAVGVVLSQALIVLHWPDAWAGTAANLLVAVAVIVAVSTARFERRIDGEAEALLASPIAAAPSLVRPHEVAPLPAPVRRWLERSGVVGRERAHTVRLRQRGGIRTARDRAFMPAEAEQYFTVDPPGFVWRVHARMMRVLPIVGRDRYADGRGHMLIKVASLVPVADGTGPEIDQGSLLRYLAEIIWFPSAALSRSITWEPDDDSSATATITSGGITATARFTFDDQGRGAGMTARRHIAGDQGGTLRTWTGSNSEWRVIRGVEIPVRGVVSWKMDEGDFDYYRWEILDVEVNRPALYREDDRALRAARGRAGAGARSAVAPAGAANRPAS
jgi:hypothetical protein